jgi:hypothetical protein
MDYKNNYKISKNSNNKNHNKIKIYLQNKKKIK